MKRRILFITILFFALALVMSLLKLPFMALHLGDFSGGEWCEVLRHGFSLDMTVAGYITALPLLLVLAWVWLPFGDKSLRMVLLCYFVPILFVVALVHSVDLGLYGYWGYRIDSSVLLYLSSPKEAMASLSAWDWVLGIVAVLLIYSLLLVGAIYLLRLVKFPSLSIPHKLLCSLVLLFMSGLCFLAIRGGVSVAVANVSKVYFSSEQKLNHAATNPLFSLLSTLGDDKDMEPQYLFFSDEELAERFGEIRGDRSDSGGCDKLLRTPRPNVVIILLESFGRSWMDEKVGSEYVMPTMQRLKSEGVWFENCYANSFRTDRGQVAILNGYPAQTRMSIMKYPAKSRTLPSLALSLLGEGYSTWFTYGGDLNFTDQAACMYATGWQRLTWQKDLNFDAPTSKWGYADDVMADYFVEQLLALDKEYRTTGKNYLAGWLTLSSHEPFEVPYSKFEDKILNSAAFTDAQLGRVIDTLKASPAWDDMLLILIADHSYTWPLGIGYNTPERHHIPMIWTGGAISSPRVIDTYCSQIDLAATLFAQMGIDHSDFIFSKDILCTSLPHFGYYCFNDGFAVLYPDGKIIYDNTTSKIIDSINPDSLYLNYGKALLQQTYLDIRTR